jgi:hypothetical protein
MRKGSTGVCVVSTQCARGSSSSASDDDGDKQRPMRAARRACTLTRLTGLGISSAMPAAAQRARSSSLHDAVSACVRASAAQQLSASGTLPEPMERCAART